jgi:hypothetical protein
MNPWPSWPPIRLSTGTRTLSKNSSLVSCDFRPTLSSLRPRRKPGVELRSPSASVSTTISDVPLAPSALSVLQTTMMRFAFWPLVMNVLEPLIT